VSGQISFVIGTKFGGIVNRDPEEVPLSEILDHVTPAELQRYEHREYLLEDILEESRPPSKPKGRPRKKLITREITSRQQSTTSIDRDQPLNRPRTFAVIIPVPSPASQRAGIDISTAVMPERLAAQAASIDRTRVVRQYQKTPVSDTTSSDRPSSRRKPTRRPQYSMLAASGLAPSESSSDEYMSRDHDPLTWEGEPLPKRRKLASPGGQLDQHLDGAAAGASLSLYRPRPESPLCHGAKESDSDPVDTIDIKDEEAEREALLRQFQIKNIPKGIPRSQSPHVTTAAHLDPDPSASSFTTETASTLARNILDKVNAQSYRSHDRPAPSVQVDTPRKAIRRPTSLTPHFPCGARRGSHASGRGIISANNSDSVSTTKTMPFAEGRKSSQDSNHFAPSRPKTPTPPNFHTTHNEQGLAATPSSAPAPYMTRNTPQNSQPRFQGLRNFKPTTDITQYFRPKSKSNNVTPLISSETESESDDPLSQISYRDPNPKVLPSQERVQPNNPISEDCDSDSLRSKAIVVQRRSQLSRPTTTVDRPRAEVPDSEDDKINVYMVAGRNFNESDPASSSVRNAVDAENGGGSEGQDDDDDESSEEDSDDSEVMIIQDHRGRVTNAGMWNA